MPDITMCSGKGCPFKLECYRYRATPNSLYQSYFYETPFSKNGCDYKLDLFKRPSATIVMKGNWLSLKNSKPDIDEKVGVCHMVTGIGAPERSGWESIGRLRKNGSWSISYNKNIDFRKPTHWRKLTQQNK